jgi:hypothetical protein
MLPDNPKTGLACGLPMGGQVTRPLFGEKYKRLRRLLIEARRAQGLIQTRYIGQIEEAAAACGNCVGRFATQQR